jgi:N-glycosylase/DNA lyase
MTISVPVPARFSFWRTVYSHGWCSLQPFEVVKDRERLRRVFHLSNGGLVTADVYPASSTRLAIETVRAGRLTAAGKRELVSSARSCLRLDEDFSGFYASTQKHPRFRWVARTSAGRMLRSPTVFEDVVKMICTTNCSWALTTIMVNNLCRKLGKRVGEQLYSFPQPGAIAECTEKFLRKEISAGYRAPYLLELSKRILANEVDPESWRMNPSPTGELFNEIRSLKGVGPYAAGNILKLLGRYDYLGIDSWCRKKFSDIHKNGRATTDRVIEKFYSPFGTWKGLFFWMDVTKDWYKKKYPF